MHCETLKPGIDCTFMTKKGCSFNGGSCKTVVTECEGCDRILGSNGSSFCASFPDPASQMAPGGLQLGHSY